ncbi:uncharacterized protein (DUF2164 family) [Lysobacter enzymogenes]|uniref:DUF2164 domain-containing protein n=1 Tax=Lysobacter enzymogenes TaxID=69 RepID=UPI00089B3EE3|nr:DUF2164 domain-containing protein [Lysobacter enzymogenes]SDY10821.1 Uncharacterized conserved protein, DUF2164 family [Lysobacter enzymogenes]
MDTIRFDDQEKALLVAKLQRYFTEELKQPIGRFDAEFLLDFLSEELGAYYYNRGVADAQAVLTAKAADLADAVWQLERPTEFKR